MSLKKRMNKSTILALGLVIGGMYASAGNIYADNKVEVTSDKKQEMKTENNEIVVADILNIRKGPSEDEEKIGALKEGSVVEVLETKDGWDKIKLSDEKEGWVSGEFTVKEKAKVNVDELNLRKGPSTDEEKLETLKNDTVVEVLKTAEIKDEKQDIKEVWHQVKLVEDEATKSEKEASNDDKKEEKTGWVSAEYVLTESQERKQKEEEAKRQQELAQMQQLQRVEKINNVVSNATSNNQKTSEGKSNVVDKKESVKEAKATSNTKGRKLTVNASAYSGHSITATGTTPKWGTIAVDPSVIPYGTKVYIPMFDKVFVAEDCGGAIKGNKIDIFMGSEQQCTNFGRQNIEIQILG